MLDILCTSVITLLSCDNITRKGAKLQLVRLFNLDLRFGDIPYAGDKNGYYIKIAIRRQTSYVIKRWIWKNFTNTKIVRLLYIYPMTISFKKDCEKLRKIL